MTTPLDDAVAAVQAAKAAYAADPTPETKAKRAQALAELDAARARKRGSVVVTPRTVAATASADLFPQEG